MEPGEASRCLTGASSTIMEFFKQTNIHWMQKAKYFFALSGTLLVIGIIACVHNGGLSYGIDFKGGTLVTVGFAQAPNVDAIRHNLEAQGLGDSTIQSVHDISNPNANQLQIGLPVKSEGAQALDEGKTTIIKALTQSFPAGPAGKVGFQFGDTCGRDGLSDAQRSARPGNSSGRSLHANRAADYKFPGHEAEWDHQGFLGLKQFRRAAASSDFGAAAVFTPDLLASRPRKSLGRKWERNCGVRRCTLRSMLWRACWYILRFDLSGFTAWPR